MLRKLDKVLLRLKDGALNGRLVQNRKFSAAHQSNYVKCTKIVTTSLLSVGGIYLIKEHLNFVHCAEKSAESRNIVVETSDVELQHLKIRDDLSFYTDEEIAKHDNKYHFQTNYPTVDTFDIIGNSWEIERENGIWLSYGVGVYDITKLIDRHGTPEETILLAAGMSLDPFFEDEDMHKIHNKPRVLALLEKCRIGNLVKKEE